MTKEELATIIEAHRKWISGEPGGTRAVLCGAVLRGSDLSGSDLRDAVLRGAVLRGSDLSGSDLRDADLRGAVLSGADLRDADLRDADLRGADLRDADLRGAVLRGAVKIRAMVSLQGNYRYEIWAYVSVDGVPYVRMGCLTYTVEMWDKIGIEKSNVSEFPDDGSPKSLARARAFRFARGSVDSGKGGTVIPFRLSSDALPRPRFTRRTGYAAQKVGRAFQDMIADSAAMQRDVVTLEELPSLGAKYIGGGKPILTKICVDFIGCLNHYEIAGSGPDSTWHPAIPLFFDAKNCGKKATGFDANQWHAERPHQSKFLRRMSKAGAMAGLMVRSEERGRYLWANIEDVDTLDTIRFAYDGRLCRQWVDLGPIDKPIDFRRLRI